LTEKTKEDQSNQSKNTQKNTQKTVKMTKRQSELSKKKEKEKRILIQTNQNQLSEINSMFTRNRLNEIM
jgi:hypothetical protein